MNGYDLSRNWFDFCMNNRKAKPQHTALYMWIIELNNRLSWKEEFGLPTLDTMEVLSIGNRNTYFSALKDLMDWGFIYIVQESKNQYQSCVIKVLPVQKCTSIDTTIDTTIDTSIATTIDTGSVHIDKPIKTVKTYKPLKPIKHNIDSEKSESLKEKKGIKKMSIVTMMKKEVEAINEGYYWTAKDAKNAKLLSTKIAYRFKAKYNQEPNDEQILESFKIIIQKLPEWYVDKWDVALLNSHFHKIITQISNQNGKSVGNTLSKRYSDEGAAFLEEKFSKWFHGTGQ